jgi:hypothetical protein
MLPQKERFGQYANCLLVWGVNIPTQEQAYREASAVIALNPNLSFLIFKVLNLSLSFLSFLLTPKST